MAERLKETLENLYNLFNLYNHPTNTNSNTVDNSNSNWKVHLIEQPLNQLKNEHLSEYLSKAISNWGTAEDFKYFLPRILELTANYKAPYDVWMVFDKLELANWTSWVEEEKQAILDYLTQLFNHLLHDESETAQWSFFDYFVSIANLYPNFSELLQKWESAGTKASFKHLSTFVADQNHIIFIKGQIDEFKHPKVQTDLLKEWLLSSTLIQKVKEAYSQYESEDFADQLSWTEQILNHELSQRGNSF